MNRLLYENEYIASITNLKAKYEGLMHKSGWNCQDNSTIESIMQESIIEFMRAHKNVALYGYGRHTEQLLLDYAGELRQIRIIIDNFYDRNKETGYKIITENEIRNENIDGVIISIYTQREAVIRGLAQCYPEVDVLDFYKIFEERGIHIVGTYYGQGQGIDSYRKINLCKSELHAISDTRLFCEKMRKLIGLFCVIKDFFSAKETAKTLCERSYIESDKQLLTDINDLYQSELEMFERIPSSVVYMLCIDGLRRADLTRENMPKLFETLEKKCVVYGNAYAYSTSTFESLIAAYGENTDQKTHYYKSSQLEEGNCRFVEMAKCQKRKIILNTGTGRFFDDKYVEYHSGVTTITQHIWDFLISTSESDNLLYYSQPQCESHFPFCNPNSQKPVLDGTFMLFDYLDRYGCKLRTDYDEQRKDALMYMDEILSPFFQRLQCKFVVYADHGSVAFGKTIKLEDINRQYFGGHEDWIRIPLFIHGDIDSGYKNELVSLLDINDIVISLLEGRAFEAKPRMWIKIGRSEIYNPDFRMVYRKAGCEHFLLAFEGFIFGDKKLVIYSDHSMELYSTENDEIIDDDELRKSLYCMISNEITVL